MKSLLLMSVSLGLVLILDLPAATAQQEEDAPKAAPMKPVPTPGKLEIKVTSGEKMETYDHPSKSLRDISRAVGRAKRAKEGEEPVFEAVVTLNDQVFTFSDPEAAQNACKTLAAAMRELPRWKMGLGDLGEIPEVKPEDKPQPAATPGNKPMGKISPAAARAIVRQRINAAVRRQMIGTGNTGASIRIPNPVMMQQIVQQEVARARREGLLPDNTTGANGGGALAGDPREAKKEAIVQTLAFAFAEADATPKEQPAETQKKPGEPKTPEAADKK